MIGGQNIFDKRVRHKLMAYDSIQKIAISQGDDYTTGCLLDYNYLKIYSKIIAIDLRKQEALDAAINFTGNIAQEATIFFITEKVKQAVLVFSQVTVKIFESYFLPQYKIN